MRRSLTALAISAALLAFPSAALAQTAEVVCPDEDVAATGSAAALPEECEVEVLPSNDERERPPAPEPPAVEVLPQRSERLPRTGVGSAALALGALASIGAGTGAVMTARKRES